MILIPDIHINAKYGDKILQTLEEIFKRHDDQEILFLGDYVFMFSYDRTYLLQLFQLFVRLYQQGRTVKVISGNHDWIQGHFVFAEWKHAFDLIWERSSWSHWSLSFITQPTHWVDEHNHLHIILPYNDHLQAPEESDYYQPSLFNSSSQHEIRTQSELLCASHNSWEQLSWLLNTIALTYYETNHKHFDHIQIYHHYYTASVAFPTVQAKFSYKDGALHPWLLNLPWLYLISGHIHKPFSYQHYLCCGSFRHTSTLEINEMKYYFVGDTTNWWEAHMNHINPQIQVEQLEEIDNQIDSMVVLSWEIIKGEQIRTSNVSPLMYNQIDLRLKVSDHTWWVDMMNNPLIQPFHSFQIKYTPSSSEWSLFTSAIESDYRTSFTDWKQLLQEYINHAYPDQSTHLLEFLQKNKIV